MKHFIFILVSLFLVGCETNPPKPEIIYKEKIRVVSVSQSLLTKCHSTIPPTIDEYLGSDNKEKLIFDYSEAILVDLKNCSDKIDSIRTSIENLKKLYP